MREINRLLLLALVLTGTITVGAKVKSVTIRGYVTNVTSPTQFEIEDYRITRDSSFILDFENASPELQFKPEDIRVGVELAIKGTFNDETNELKATSIKVDMEQFKKQKQTAILARAPEGVERTNDGWSGTFFVDGQRIRITPATQVVFQLTKREKGLAKAQSRKPTKGEDGILFRPLASLTEVTVGAAMTYEGARDIHDGEIVAERVEFAHNDLEVGEKQMWDSLKMTTRPFLAASLTPGELNIRNVGKFKVLPDQETQDYVSQLGYRLVPKYQLDLDDGDPAKIPFKFFVVQDKVPNAFALPNGIVVIHSAMFDVVQNEAQFAAVVGHEISHAVQEHTWRQQQHQKVARTALAIGAAFAAAYGQNALRDTLQLVQGAIQNGYARNLENQADRLGLEYMVAAGYDPREAPRVWKEMTNKLGDAPTDFFWSNHDNNATRRSYLMNELKNNYADLDYSALRTDEKPFKAIADKVRLAQDRKIKVKVTH